MVGLFWHLFCQMDFVSGLSRQIAASFDDASTWLQLVLRCFASAPAKQSWRGDEQNEDEITVQTVRRGIRCQQLNNKQKFFWTMKCNHYKLLVIHCDNPCLSTHDSLRLSILQPLGWRMPSLDIFCRFIEHWSHPYASSPHVLAVGPLHLTSGHFFAQPLRSWHHSSGVYVVTPSQVSWIPSLQSVSQHNDKWTQVDYEWSYDRDFFPRLQKRYGITTNGRGFPQFFLSDLRQKLQRHAGLKRIGRESHEESVINHVAPNEIDCKETCSFRAWLLPAYLPISSNAPVKAIQLKNTKFHAHSLAKSFLTSWDMQKVKKTKRKNKKTKGALRHWIINRNYWIMY